MGYALTIALTTLTRAVRQTLAHPLATDSTMMAASQYLAAGIGILTGITAARLLGPADYGTAALVMAYPSLLWSFVEIKSVSVTTRYIASLRAAKRHEELKGLCKLAYGLDFAVACLACLLISLTHRWFAASVYHMPQVSFLMIAYAISFPFYSLVGASWAILSSWRQFRWLAVFQVVHRLITLCTLVGFLFSGFGVPGMVLANAAGDAACGIMMMTGATYVLYRDGLGFWWNGSLRKVTPQLRELVTSLGWNYVAITLSGLIGLVPVILLGRYRSAEEAGFYRLATSLTTIGSYLEHALGRVSYPVLSERWSSGERQSLRNSMKRWTLRGGLPAAALVLLTIPLLPIFLPIVLGPSYSPMAVGVQVMMVGAAASTVFFWLNTFYYAVGMISLWTKAYAIYVGIGMGLGCLGIQQWGFYGFAWGFTVGKGLLIALLLYRFQGIIRAQ